MKNSLSYYKNNIEKINEQLKSLEKKLIAFSIIRFIIVILGLIAMYYYYKQDSIEGLGVSFLCALFVFLIIVFFHSERINLKKRLLTMLEYYEKGIKRLDNTWKEFSDIGEEFIDKNHSFSSDLDIFGKKSLFQWINLTRTKFGRKKLAHKMMLNDLPTRYEIQDNQEAIKELSKKRDFCEKLYFEATIQNKNKENIEELLKWDKSEEKNSFTIKYVSYIFIAITLILIFLTIIGRFPVTYLLLDLMINYLVIKLLTRKLSSVIDTFINNKREIIKYSNLLGLIQDESFESKKLLELQKDLLGSNINCKAEMKKLRNIVNWLGDSTSNAYYLIINVFLMSDIFILCNLEEWRIKNGYKLEKWLEIMGEIEALVSLSTLAFEHQAWSYAKISGVNEIEARGLAHPLLGERAKVNDFNLCGNERVALITGSNMSGKSTFLRTIGFNMILTYLGLPTCSKFFKCGISNIYTCMRTQDNLDENISSFYAEILRIKLVIEAAKSGKKVFFLLDEIFKGTNSQDRHDGARILIEQLVKLQAVGLVSTHDLELCNLEQEKSWLVNYNFREYYKNNKINFDYILRRGKSETQNAKHLMKLAGIDIED
ncbi:MAG: DNA mismatch repair protein MutS [Clostridium sp.]|uniref:MutS-related protein n=1 Tax=Clostridium sp. TaxID=1506 RepID=UPI0025BFE6F3|nr:DNA mismatch repair protein MutS [Clostridium sp.]MCI9303319.1 DNA mismatch repair protein MutS [Clostridium sp.]